MLLRHILGGLMLATPFIGLFFFGWKVIGIKAISLTFGGIILLGLFLYAGCILLGVPQ